MEGVSMYIDLEFSILLRVKFKFVKYVNKIELLKLPQNKKRYTL